MGFCTRTQRVALDQLFIGAWWVCQPPLNFFPHMFLETICDVLPFADVDVRLLLDDCSTSITEFRDHESWLDGLRFVPDLVYIHLCMQLVSTVLARCGQFC